MNNISRDVQLLGSKCLGGQVNVAAREIGLGAPWEPDRHYEKANEHPPSTHAPTFPHSLGVHFRTVEP